MKNRPDYIIDTRARRGLSLSTLNRHRPTRTNGRAAQIAAYIAAALLTLAAALSTIHTTAALQ